MNGSQDRAQEENSDVKGGGMVSSTAWGASGVMTALCTPFTADGARIDEGVLRELVRSQVDAGIDALVPGGSTGEFTSLTHGERKRLVEVVVEAAGGQVPVVAHCGAAATAPALDLARHAEAAGAAAVMAVHPFYAPLSLEEILDYYAELAGALEVPVVAYNIPGFTGTNMTPEFLSRLAREVEGVVAVKDTSGDLSHVYELLHDHSAELDVLNGWDAIAAPVLEMGGLGQIVGSANLMPRQWVRLFALHREGRREEAADLWDRMLPVTRFVLRERFPGTVKAGTALAGVPVGDPRPPYGPLAPDRVVKLRALLERAGALREPAAAP
jgi:4-hydroxy-tetrahydrodipicolinate synthase